jgi:hypothetical protein
MSRKKKPTSSRKKSSISAKIYSTHYYIRSLQEDLERRASEIRAAEFILKKGEQDAILLGKAMPLHCLHLPSQIEKLWKFQQLQYTELQTAKKDLQFLIDDRYEIARLSMAVIDAEFGELEQGALFQLETIEKAPPKPICRARG